MRHAPDLLTPRTDADAPRSGADIALRRPAPEDAAAVWDLISASPPLDQNSLYMNLIQCTHFADTCVLAERDGAAVGWVSGHIPPNEPETVFVWQVAVAADARGEGLARRLVHTLLARPACAGVRTLKTTITPGNEASWALFRALAADLGAPLDHAPWFTREKHFAGRHDTEHLLTIGPFAADPPRG